MKKRMRSFFALFLALVTVFGMTQQYTASAASTTKTVSTQKELEAALKSKTIKTIKISNAAGKSLKIPKGTYSKTLVIVSDKVKITVDTGATLSGINVDKTNATSQIIVNGTVKTVNVIKKANVTITGKTVDTVAVNNKATNSTIKTSVTSKVTATKKANLLFKNGADNSTVVAKADVKVSVSKNTNVKSVTAAKSGIECNIVANGPVAEVKVTAKADIAISGETKAKIGVTVSEAAKGTTLESSKPVDITAKGNVKVDLKEGAEGSKVTTTDKKVFVEINNATKDKVTVVTPEGSKDIGAGNKGTAGTPEATAPPVYTPGSGGGSNNGGGTSTPNPTKVAKDALQKTYDENKDIVQVTTEKNYSTNSWKVFADARTNADTVLKATTSDRAAYETANSTLVTAKAALKDGYAITGNVTLGDVTQENITVSLVNEGVTLGSATTSTGGAFTIKIGNTTVDYYAETGQSCSLKVDATNVYNEYLGKVEVGTATVVHSIKLTAVGTEPETFKTQWTINENSLSTSKEGTIQFKGVTIEVQAVTPGAVGVASGSGFVSVTGSAVVGANNSILVTYEEGADAVIVLQNIHNAFQLAKTNSFGTGYTTLSISYDTTSNSINIVTTTSGVLDTNTIKNSSGSGLLSAEIVGSKATTK